jgi:hypothetical protein
MQAYTILVFSGISLCGCYQEPLKYVPSYPRPYTYTRPYESVRPLPSHHHPQRTSSFRQPEDDGSAPVSWHEVEEVNIPSPIATDDATPPLDEEVIGADEPHPDRSLPRMLYQPVQRHRDHKSDF